MVNESDNTAKFSFESTILFNRSTLGLCRVVCACLVVLTHAYNYGAKLRDDPLFRVTGISMGDVCVSIFFSLRYNIAKSS